jgi:hypothetical protein
MLTQFISVEASALETDGVIVAGGFDVLFKVGGAMPSTWLSRRL